MAFAATGRQQDRKRGAVLPKLLRLCVYLGLAGLIALSTLSPERFHGPRLVAQQAAAPLVWLYEAPVKTVREVIQFCASYLFVHSENARLRQQLLDTDATQRRLDHLEHENSALKQQLKAANWSAQIIATGRVLSHGGGTYLKSILVAAGQSDGVANGQAAVTSAGLVGQVVAVSDNLSRVLVINDFSSRIPVQVNETNTPGIAEGTNDRDLALSFLPINFSGRVGAYVSTSGAGGLFPAGIPVGTLLRGESSDRPTAYGVRPFADLEAAGFVTFLAAPKAEAPELAPLPDQLTSQLLAADTGGG